jgi:hypothetical protein
MAFFESPRFPDDISYGAEFDTSFVSQDQLDVLLAFFRICKGRANGFRFKDWSDKVERQT